MASEAEPRVMRVLARTKTVLRSIEKEMVRARVKYKMLGGIQFAERREIKDFLAFWHWFVNQDNRMAKERFSKAYKMGLHVKKPKAENVAFVDRLRAQIEAEPNMKRKIMLAIDGLSVFKHLAADKNDDDEDVSRLDNFKLLMDMFNLRSKDPCDVENVEDMIDAFAVDRQIKEEQAPVVLQTIHSAKGQEADLLVLAGWNDGTLPFYKACTPEEQHEERRLAFVAITRAKGDVYITSTELPAMSPSQCDPSPFIKNIESFIEERYVH